MKKILNKLHVPHWLCLVLVMIFLLRIPSFFEPFSYGDEMIYLTLGQAIKKGLILYKDIHDNKPPLLYFIASLAGNVFWLKVILAFWMLATTVLFWKLVRIFFKEKLQKIAVIFFAVLTTLPLLEGQIANAELFMLAPTLLGFYLLFSQKKTKRNRVVLAGSLFALATLFKVPAALDMPAIVFFWLATTKLSRKNIFKIAKDTFYLLIGFSIPIAFTFVWYYSQGALADYFVAAFGQNLGYLSSFRPSDLEKSFLARNAPLLIRGGLTGLGIFLVSLFAKRKPGLSQPFIFASILLFLNLFAITLSERPYPHYLIQYVPAVSILATMLVAANSIEQTLVVMPLFLALLAPVYYEFWYYPSLPYYERFLKFAFGQTSRQEYFNQFDSKVTGNYAIANFIANLTRPEEKVFVWGDSAPIYALSRRLPPIKYVADYHIRDFSSKEAVMLNLTAQKPKLVVILPQTESFKDLGLFVNQNYLLVATIENAEIWKLR